MRIFRLDLNLGRISLARRQTQGGSSSIYAIFPKTYKIDQFSINKNGTRSNNFILKKKIKFLKIDYFGQNLFMIKTRIKFAEIDE